MSDLRKAAAPEPVPVLGLISDEVCAELKGADSIELDFIYGIFGKMKAVESQEAYRTYTAPEFTHPGYIIGNHWLETAYSRICAGEAEANVLRDYGLMREEAFTIGVEHLRQENERLRGLLRETSKAVWMNYQNDLLDRIETALKEMQP